MGPLGAEATGALAARLLGEPGLTPTLEAITAEAEGNPSFITEVARHLRETRGGGSTPDVVRRTSLDQVIAARVQRLPDPARQLLTTVAVAGQPIGEVLATRAARLDGAGRAALAALCAGHLCRLTTADETHVECYHDRIRQVVLGTLDEAARRRCHWRLARVSSPPAPPIPSR